MESNPADPRRYRRAAALVAVSAFPFAAYLVARELGIVGLVKLAITGLAAAGIGAAMFARPRFGVYCMLFDIYSGMSFYVPAVVAMSVLGIMALAAVIEMFYGGTWRLRDATFVWCVALFGVVAFQSMLWAHHLGYAWTAFTQFAKAVLLVAMIVQWIRAPDHVREAGAFIFVGAVATIVFGLMNLELGIDEKVHFIGGVNLLRFAGAHDNPNYAAAFMVSALPMGMMSLVLYRHALLRIAGAAGLLLLVVGVFATFSRAALFGFALVVIGTVAREVRGPRGRALVFIFLVAGVLLTPRYYWVRVTTLTEVFSGVQYDWSIYLRAKALSLSWHMFLEHPILGVGLNNFIVRSAPDLFLRIGVHNAYFEILSGLGVFGLLAYLSILLTGLRRMTASISRAWPADRFWLSRFSYYLSLGFLSSLLSAMFANLEFNYMLWVPIAIALAIARMGIHECA